MSRIGLDPVLVWRLKDVDPCGVDAPGKVAYIGLIDAAEVQSGPRGTGARSDDMSGLR